MKIEEDRYEFSVLDICHVLHSSRYGGTAEQLTGATRLKYRNWLDRRIQNWAPNTCSYDALVYALACVALAEED